MQLSLFQDYYDKGLSLIPLIQGTKRPIFSWKRYQRIRATEEEVRLWVKCDWNLGIVLGPISNLAVIDVDDETLIPELERRFPIIADTARVRTKRGYHHYFKTDRNIPRTKNVLGLGVELRNYGCYCVAPDSMVNGITYAWESPLDNILDLPDELSRLSRYQDVPVSAVYLPFRSGDQKCIQQILNYDIEHGNRNESLFCLFCLLLKKNKSSYAMAQVRIKNRNLKEPVTRSELGWICDEAKNSYHKFGCEAVRKRLPFIDCSNCQHFHRGFRMKENLILKHYKSIPDRSGIECKILDIIELHFDGEIPSITKLSKTAKIDWRIVNKAVQQLKKKGIL